MSERETTAITVGPPVPSGGEAVCRVQHTGPEPLSTTLAVAIGEHTDVDPTEFRLYSYVDPDALDALFEPYADPVGQERGWIEFRIPDHRVVIRSSGEVVIVADDADDAPA
jgi:hypothetical protein